MYWVEQWNLRCKLCPVHCSVENVVDSKLGTGWNNVTWEKCIKMWNTGTAMYWVEQCKVGKMY